MMSTFSGPCSCERSCEATLSSKDTPAAAEGARGSHCRRGLVKPATAAAAENASTTAAAAGRATIMPAGGNTRPHSRACAIHRPPQLWGGLYLGDCAQIKAASQIGPAGCRRPSSPPGR